MMPVRRYAGISLSLLVLDGSFSPANAQRAILLLRHAERVEYESPLGHPGQITIGPREHDDIFVIVPASGGPPTVVRLNY